VHLRRALLLFAIVLGLAALAASVSRPRDEGGGGEPLGPGAPPATETQRTPTATPGPESQAGPDAPITFAAGGADEHSIAAGQSATVLVEVDDPGQVEIPELGLNDAATPVTPARFEVFAPPGAYELRFTPAGASESSAAGTLTVTGEA
jgi:hypothetical protein